ncbi:MAG TPA: hypothetical protein VHR66_10780 [Gemmataceae bacterium]|nr:hypothetical protein [Gemmataceae bacterium]
MKARLLLATMGLTLFVNHAMSQVAQPKQPPPPVVVDKPPPGPAITPTARPPELVKLEAEAAAEIPTPAVPGGKAPEAKRVAETTVQVRRATWVVEKLLPPPPEGIAALNFGAIRIGNRGWLDTTGEVTKVTEGIMVVRPSGVAADGIAVGLPATDAATTVKTVSLRGEYLVDRALTVDGRDVLVLKEVAAAKALDPAQSRLINAARVRLEEAKAEYANAVAVLTAAKKKAVDAVMEKAQAQAAKQIPVPENADGEQRIKAKRDQDELAGKLAKAELDKIAEAYGVVPAADPTRK